MIGAWIVEYEPSGEDRAANAAAMIDDLARELADAGVRGMGRSNLRSFRQLASTWPDLDVVGATGRSGTNSPDAVWLVNLDQFTRRCLANLHPSPDAVWRTCARLASFDSRGAP